MMDRKGRHGRFWVFGFGFLLVLTAGCGYRLAQGLPFPNNRLFVAPVTNATQEPGLEDRFRSALLETIAVDGRFRITSEENAGLVLNSTIDGYDFQPTSESSGLATQYEIRMTATFVFREPAGTVVAEYPGVRAPVWQSYRAGADVMTTERLRFQATEEGVRALAREFLGRIYGP